MRPSIQRVPAALAGVILAALTLGTGVSGVAQAAAQEVLVRAGGPGTPTGVVAGGQIEVPFLVDMTRTGETVSSVSVAVSWNPDHFDYVSSEGGSFGTVVIDDADAELGRLHATSSGGSTTSTFTLATVTLQTLAEEATSAPVGIAVTGLGDEDGRDLTLLAESRPLWLCVGASGLWGDANGDGVVNIIDAQQVARHVVALPVVDATTLTEAGDVNDDGLVSIVDAQHIARHSVGLTTQSSRVGQLLGAGCTEPGADEVRLEPQRTQIGLDTTETLVARTFKDGEEVGLSTSPSWRSTNPAVATVEPPMTTAITGSGIVTAVAPGTTYILATVDGLLAPAARITVSDGVVCSDISDYVVAAIEFDHAVGGSLGLAGDCLDDQWYVQAWTLTLENPEVAEVKLRSPELDAFLYVLDADGRLIAQDDDSGEGTDAELTTELEAGTYYLVASSALPFETGNYNLSVGPGEVIEPCSLIGHFVVGTIALNTSESGSLETGDCQFADETFAEAWELELTSPTGVRIDLESGDFTPYLLLVDSDGATVAERGAPSTGTAATIARSLEAGTYYVFANTTAPGEAGSYQVSVAEEAVGPSCTSIEEFFAGTVVVGEPIDAVLTTDDCLDVNWYTQSWTLDLAGTETLLFDLHSSEFDAFLAVLDEAGTLVAADDDSGVGTDAQLNLTLEPGTYHVLASTSLAYETGAYTLSVADVYGAGTDCSELINFLVGPIALNSMESSNLGAEDCQLEAEGWLAEAWELELNSATGVQIDLESAAFDAFVYLLDSEGAELARNDDAGTGTNARIARNLDAGTYHIYAGTTFSDESGAYDLTVAEADVGPTCTTMEQFEVGPVASGDGVSGTLAITDCLNGHWFTDGWRLELTATEIIQFELVSDDFEPYVWVADETGTFIGDGSATTAGTAEVTLELGPGTYYVLASSSFSYHTGSYTLTLSPGALTPEEL